MNGTISPLFLSPHTVQCIYYATLSLHIAAHWAGLGTRLRRIYTRLCHLTIYWRNYTSSPSVKSAQVCPKWRILQKDCANCSCIWFFSHLKLFFPSSTIFCLCHRIWPSVILHSNIGANDILLVVVDCNWTVLRKQWKEILQLFFLVPIAKTMLVASETARSAIRL